MHIWRSIRHGGGVTHRRAEVIRVLSFRRPERVHVLHHRKSLLHRVAPVHVLHHGEGLLHIIVRRLKLSACSKRSIHVWQHHTLSWEVAWVLRTFALEMSDSFAVVASAIRRDCSRAALLHHWSGDLTRSAAARSTILKRLIVMILLPILERSDGSVRLISGGGAIHGRRRRSWSWREHEIGIDKSVLAANHRLVHFHILEGIGTADLCSDPSSKYNAALVVLPGCVAPTITPSGTLAQEVAVPVFQVAFAAIETYRARQWVFIRYVPQTDVAICIQTRYSHDIVRHASGVMLVPTCVSTPAGADLHHVLT